MSRLWQTCLILIILVAVAVPLRWANLAQRPFHADESVQAMKFRTYWKTGVYKYNPNEFHGPSFNYVSIPIQWFSKQDIDTENEAVLRSVPAVFSLISICLLFLFRKALGRSGTLLSGILLVVSPSLLFYSRYYIHETELFTFSLLFLGSLWCYTQTGKRRWILTSGIALGLMYATKETFVFNVAAGVGGLFILLGLEKFKGAPVLFLKRIPLTHWLLAFFGLIITGLLFFTSFFTNWAGPIDSLRTYMPWLNRAGGQSPHIWPWHYYLQRFFWFSKDGGPHFTELFILLPAVLGIWAGFKDHFSPAVRRFSIFLGSYTLLLGIIYCVIPYKTPWCFICVMQGFILLAGIGTHYAITAWKNGVARAFVCLVLVAGSVHLLGQANQLNKVYYEESKNPHVYAHTISDVRNIVRTVEKLSSIHPDGEKMLIQVITKNGDCWPLPWYLRKFDDTTGWYSDVPQDLRAPVLIFSPNFASLIKERTENAESLDKTPHYKYAGFYGFRPGVFLQIYVEEKLWSEYVAKGLAADDDEDEDE